MSPQSMCSLLAMMQVIYISTSLSKVDDTTDCFFVVSRLLLIKSIKIQDSGNNNV
jgi:hypothetical protein